MLRIEKLTLRFGEKVLFRDFSFQMEPGEHVALMGANGSGKSTLLRLLAGAADAVQWEGEILVAGQPLGSSRKPSVAWVPQEPLQDVALRADEYVMLGRTAYLSRWGRPSDEDRNVVREAMKQTETTALAAAKVNEVSGGEQQRLSLALALATEADLLLLDEPTSHLDLRYRRQMKRLISGLRNKSVLMALHDLDWAHSCSKVLLIHHQRVDEGSPDELLSEASLRHAFGF